MSAALTSWFAWIVSEVSVHNPGLAPAAWAGVLAVGGFLAAALLGRVLAALVRVGIIVPGVLVAASVLRGGPVL